MVEGMLPSFETARDIVVFALAIWGAALSTYTFFTSVRKERRSIAVTLSTAIPTLGTDLGPTFVKVEAVNIGHRPVTVTNLTIEHNGKWIYPMRAFQGLSDTALPVQLQDGQSAHMHMAYRDIGLALLREVGRRKVKLTPVCIDSTGRKHRGRPWRGVDLEEISNM